MILNIINYVILLQYFFYITNCQEKHRSLIVTETNGEFKLTKPVIYNFLENRFIAPSAGKTYHFCLKDKIDVSENKENKTETQDYDSEVNKLYKQALSIEKRVKKKEATSDEDVCKSPLATVLVKVKKPGDFKINWHNGIDLYHSGFLVYRKDMKRNASLAKKLRCAAPLCIIPNTDEHIVQKYELLSNDYSVILGIELHFDQKLKQTIAVEYTLLSTNGCGNLGLQNLWFEKVSPEGITPPYNEYINEDNDEKFIESIVGTSWENYFSQKKTQNMIRTIPLAALQHFPILNWKLPAMIWSNKIPVWHHVTSQWNKVTKFSQIVAQYIGDLKVSTGITGIMFLPDGRKQPTFSDKNIISEITVEHISKPPEKWTKDEKEIFENINEVHSNIPQVLLTDKNTNFRMPNYLWAAFEYSDETNSYGILVVMHLNPFVDNTNQICNDICSANGWYISNSNFQDGKTYCCEMTPKNIEKLKANFLNIKTGQRQIFNLNNWDKKGAQIVNAYNSMNDF